MICTWELITDFPAAGPHTEGVESQGGLCTLCYQRFHEIHRELPCDQRQQHLDLIAQARPFIARAYYVKPH